MSPIADNATLPATGVVVRTKDHSSVETQILGLDVNPAGAEQLMASAAMADGVTNPTLPSWAVHALVYNGTTWDRWRGDTTNGGWVNVKASALPSGAATAAKQPALGTAGTASSDVITVQGIASGTAMTVDTELPAAAALADGTSNPTTPTVGVAQLEWNGSSWDRMQGNTLDGVQVNQKYPIWGDSLADGISALWTQTTANGGTVTTSGGEGLLKTSTATNGSSQIVGPTIAYRPGAYAWMNSAIRLGDTGTAGDIRRWGMYTVSGTTPQEGFYYELSGTTLNAVVVKAGTPTATAVGSWSLFSTAPFTLDTSYHSFQIRYTANTVQFIVDNVLRHVVTGTTTPLTTSLSLPIAATNVKTSGATDITLAIRNIGAGAFGDAGLFQVEDFASADGDRGIGAMAIRKATPANTSGSDGDYEFLQMSAGRLWTSAVIDTALPAGTNAIGKLAANSGVDIGALTANQTVNVAQVNGVTTTMGNGASGTGVQRFTLASDSTGNIATIGTSVTPGTAAGNLGKAEDAAHADGDTGVAVWSVRQDTPAATSGTTGDYSGFTTDANGALHVALVGKNVENWVEVTIAGLTTSTTTYTSGDVLGGEMTFTNAARFSGGTAAIDKIIVINNSVQLGAVDAFIFDQASTPASDNAANSWSDANMAHCVGVVPLYPAATSALNQVLSWSAAGGEKIKCNSTSAFIVLVTRSDSTFFGASTDLLTKVNFVRS